MTQKKTVTQRKRVNAHSRPSPTKQPGLLSEGALLAKKTGELAKESLGILQKALSEVRILRTRKLDDAARQFQARLAEQPDLLRQKLTAALNQVKKVAKAG